MNNARIFISYGRKDAQKLAETLAGDLSGRGYKVWIDKEQLETGNSWEEQIESAILNTDLFISLLSPHAVRRPDGVCLDEISMARYNQRRIIPLMVINCRPPLGIYRLDWLDMQDWTNPVAYEKAIKKLQGFIEGCENSVEGIHSHIFGVLNPIDFKVDIYKHVKDFVGREWILNKISAWIDDPAGKVMFLTGDPGSGKTALMAKLIHVMPQVGAYYFCMAKYEASLVPDSFIHTIAAQLATQLPEYREALSHLNLEALNSQEAGSLIRQLIVEPLNQVERAEPMVIIIDALDEALYYGSNNIAGLLYEWMDEFPPWLKIILTSRRVSEIMGLFDFYKPGEIFLDSQENTEDIRQFVFGMLSSGGDSEPGPDGNPDFALEFSKGLNPGFALEVDPGLNPGFVLQPGPGEIERMVEDTVQKSEGVFLVARTIVSHLLSNTLSPDQISSLPPGMSGIYQSSFRRIFKAEHSFDKLRPLLEIILAAYEPLGVAELASIRQLPVLEIRKQLLMVEEFFPEKEGLISEFHKSMSDWLLCTGGNIHKFACDPDNGHREIAAYLLGQWTKVGKSSKGKTPSLKANENYKLQYLVKHLFYAGQEEEAEALLGSINYLEQRCALKQVYRLIEDFKLFTSDLDSVGYGPGDDPVMWDKDWYEYEASAFKESMTEEKQLLILQEFLFRQAEWIQLYGNVKGFLRQQLASAGLFPLVFAGEEDGSARSQSEAQSTSLTQANTWDPFPAVTKIIYGHKWAITDLSMSRDGRRLASASGDRSVKLWNLDNGECINTIKNEFVVETLAMASDASFIAMEGSCDSESSDSSAMEGSSDSESSDSSAMEGSSDKSALDGPSDKYAIWVWNQNMDEVLYKLRAHSGTLRMIRLSGNDEKLLSCSADHSFRVWDLSRREILFEKSYDAPLSCGSISEDGSIVAIATNKCLVEVWNVEFETLVFKREFDKGEIRSILLSHDGRELIVGGGEDKQTEVWDIVDDDLKYVVKGHGTATHDLLLNADKSLLLSCGKDRLLRITDFNTGEPVKSFEGHTLVTRRIAAVDNLGTLASGGGWGSDRQIRLWDIFRSRGVENEDFKSYAVAAIYPLTGTHANGDDDLLCVNRKQVFSYQSNTGERSLLREKLSVQTSLMVGEVLYLALQDGSLISYHHRHRQWSELLKHSAAITAMYAVGGQEIIPGGLTPGGLLLGDRSGAVLRFEEGELRPVEREPGMQNMPMEIEPGMQNMPMEIEPGMQNMSKENNLSMQNSSAENRLNMKVKLIQESQNYLVFLDYEDHFLFIDRTGSGSTSSYRHEQRITSGIVTVDDTLFFGDATGSLVRYDIAGGNQHKLPAAHDAEITSLGWHTRSKRLLSACGGGKIKAWRSDLKSPLFEIDSQSGAISFLRMLDGPGFLSIPGGAEAVKKWHIFSGQCEAVYPLDESVSSLAIDSGGGLFVGQRDGRIKGFGIIP